MVKTYCNIVAIVEQIRQLMTDSESNIIHEDGEGYTLFTITTLKRLKGRLKLSNDIQSVNWRLSESVLDGIARHLVLV